MAVLCPIEGKIVVESKLAAEAVILDMRSTDVRGDLLAAYPCDAHWHVGHNDPGGRHARPGARPRMAPPPLTYRLTLPEHLLALLDHDEEEARCG